MNSTTLVVIEGIVSASFRLTLYFCFFVLLSSAFGALVFGLVRLITFLDDRSFSLLGRFLGVALGLYLLSHYLSSEVVAFSSRVWGSGDYYF